MLCKIKINTKHILPTVQRNKYFYTEQVGEQFVREDLENNLILGVGSPETSKSFLGMCSG